MQEIFQSLLFCGHCFKLSLTVKPNSEIVHCFSFHYANRVLMGSWRGYRSSINDTVRTSLEIKKVSAKIKINSLKTFS